VIDRKLKSDLLSKLNVSPQRLSQKIKKMKDSHGPMSTEEAAYVIAHQAGLDVSKYLPSDVTERVRELIPLRIERPAAKAAHGSKTRSSRQVLIKIGTDAQCVDTLLSTSMAHDAERMTELHAKYYVLENSFRRVISRVLESAHGVNWWDTCVPTEVKDKVRMRRLQEDKTPWHGKRGQHEIFYSDFGDLRRLIEKNWPDFQRLFPSRPWITQRLDELEPPRNVHAHHNPVSKRDQQRIDLYFHDWVDLLRSKKAELP